MEQTIRIYQCEDTTDGVLSAIYDAGVSGYNHRLIRIQPMIPGQSEDRELFAEYIPVTTEAGKAASVTKAVTGKISRRAYSYMIHALAACDSDRADAVYCFLFAGFQTGDKICDGLQFPYVKRVFQLQRAVEKETHCFQQFLRFHKVQENPPLLAAVVEPKHRILPFLTPHFAERFAEEWFIIYDKTHREASFHYANAAWEIWHLSDGEAESMEKLTEQQEEYADLWKIFVENTAVKERTNKNLQRNMLPLHYRKHMTEF